MDPAPTLDAALAIVRTGIEPAPRPSVAPRFAVGDEVTTRELHPVGHTRLPRYARGRRGTIVRHLGAASFPDAGTNGLEPSVQPVYCVRFEADELWGENADARGAVYIDIWEGYLE
jgi:nitrile hydratase